MKTISDFPGRQVRAAPERETSELTGVIEEIWHSAPLLTYVDQEETHVDQEEMQEPEDRDWPLDPAILYGLVYP